MRIRETDIDEQLDRLENIEGGKVFFCDLKDKPERFPQQNRRESHAEHRNHTRLAHLRRWDPASES